MQNLQIYKASAGSGKTHLLTQSFLKLAFENPDNFSKILAVTFTNKAAEEMKERIILEINNIIEIGNSAAHFSDIKEYTNLSDEKLIQFALEIRTNILHNYSMFMVSTIDSFVQKVIRSFSFEIGIASNYRIELDNNKVIDDLTNLLFQNTENDKQLLYWLIKFAEYKIDEGKNWDFRDEISKLATEIFKEKFQAINSTLSLSKNQIIENKKLLVEFLSTITVVKTEFQLKMKNLSDKAKLCVSNSGINIESLGRNFKTISNFLLNKIKKDDFVIIPTIEKALEGIENWYAKTAKKEVIVDVESIFPQLYQILVDVVKIIRTESINFYTAKNILDNFHSFGILNDVAGILPQYRDDNNLLLISDTTMLLKAIIGNNDAPFIYEKIGNRFKHILIDEFQDTSAFQWSNFRPLIENSLGEGHFNLIVGDIKQSIYRWRGGDWTLLLSGVKSEIGSELVEEKSLEINWRSKKNIIDFNNSIFSLAPLILQNQYNEEISLIENREIIQQIEDKGYTHILTDAYVDSFQKLPENVEKKGGRVQLNFIESEQGDSKNQWKEKVANLLPVSIDNLLKNKNYEPRDICILVRRNIEETDVVNMLYSFQKSNNYSIKYDIISAESLLLENSPTVLILISAMKYLHDERDEISLASLLNEYNNLNNKDIDFYDTLTDFKSNNAGQNTYLPDNFLSEKELLKRLSLFELCEKLILIFNLHLVKEGYPYLRVFQDTILNYTRNNNSDLFAFLNWWNEKGKSLSVQLSDKQNAVKIMTIHKSKGLAFKVVYIPFADWLTDHTSFLSAPIIWVNSDIEPFNKYEYLPVKYKKELIDTWFKLDYFDEKLYANMDALNMLYVAFTRPKEELIIFSPLPKKMDKISSVSHLLFQALQLDIFDAEKEKNKISLIKHYNRESNILLVDSNYLEVDDQKFKKSEIDIGFSIDNYPNNDWNDKLSMNFESGEFFVHSIDAIEQKVNFGILMHRVLSEIDSINDTERVLNNLYFAGYLTNTEKLELAEKVREMLARNEVKNWFLPENKVETELEVLTKDGLSKRPDRVIIEEDLVRVIDFKFGEIRNDHKEQVNEYAGFLEEIYQKNVKGYLYYFETNSVVETN